MILNENLQFDQVSQEVRLAFRGMHATKILLNSGHALYKFTAHSLVRPDGGITPFWSSVEPISRGDTGLRGLLDRSQVLSAKPETTARARSAVTQQWNPMTGLLRARLQTPAYAFAGQCSGQRVDERSAFTNVFFIGGAWQLWIPNLTSEFIVEDANP